MRDVQETNCKKGAAHQVSERPSISEVSQQLCSSEQTRTYCIDLDGVLCEKPDIGVIDYQLIYCSSIAKPEVIDKVNSLYDDGNIIIIYSARHLQDYNVTRSWLYSNGVKYDLLVLGKPWADYYIDDRALRPEEWLNGKQI